MRMVRVSKGRVRSQLTRVRRVIEDTTVVVSRNTDSDKAKSKLTDLEESRMKCVSLLDEESRTDEQLLERIDEMIEETEELQSILSGCEVEASRVSVDGLQKESLEEVTKYLSEVIKDLQLDVKQYEP